MDDDWVFFIKFSYYIGAISAYDSLQLQMWRKRRQRDNPTSYIESNKLKPSLGPNVYDCISSNAQIYMKNIVIHMHCTMKIFAIKHISMVKRLFISSMMRHVLYVSDQSNVSI